jgi:hypothetical protein
MTNRPPDSRIPILHLSLLALTALATVTSACVYDADQRCGENQLLSSDGRQCTCVPGAVMTAHGCTLCGANEVPGNGVCDCAAGYTRSTADGSCQEAPSAMGLACDLSSAPCADSKYSTCHATSGSMGYCTSVGCTTSADCQGGYACDATATPAFCKRPPVGAGRACQSSTDCAGTEATYCDLMVTHQCLVQGCKRTPDDCFTGTVCCDLSMFGVAQPICVLPGTCPT